VPPNTTVPSAGHVINVFGKVETVDGEKQITCVALTRTGSGTVPAPVGLNNRATAPVGLSAVGLRCTVWGRVDAVGGNPFTIDDGSGLNLKVYGPSGYSAVPNDYVAVVGVLGSEISGTDTVPVMRAQSVEKKD